MIVSRAGIVGCTAAVGIAIMARFCIAVGRRIGEGTAKFYLDVADGNLRDAIALYGKTGTLPLTARMPQSQVMKCFSHACQYIFVQEACRITLLFCCLH